MDSQTQRVLTRIGKEAALKYRNSLMKTTNSSQHDKERVMEYLETRGRENTRDRKTENAVRDLLQKGAFDHVTKEVNQDVAREIEKETDWKVRNAIKNGEIKPYAGPKI